MLSGEATDISFIVLSFTRSGHEPTIYHTEGEHANQYTTDVVALVCVHTYTIVTYIDSQQGIVVFDDKEKYHYMMGLLFLHYYKIMFTFVVTYKYIILLLFSASKFSYHIKENNHV
jgi:hypothetical protein